MQFDTHSAMQENEMVDEKFPRACGAACFTNRHSTICLPKRDYETKAIMIAGGESIIEDGICISSYHRQLMFFSIFYGIRYSDFVSSYHDLWAILPLSC